MTLAPPPLGPRPFNFDAAARYYAEQGNHDAFLELLTLIEAQIFAARSMKLEDWELSDLVDFFRSVKNTSCVVVLAYEGSVGRIVFDLYRPIQVEL